MHGAPKFSKKVEIGYRCFICERHVLFRSIEESSAVIALIVRHEVPCVDGWSRLRPSACTALIDLSSQFFCRWRIVKAADRPPRLTRLKATFDAFPLAGAGLGPCASSSMAHFTAECAQTRLLLCCAPRVLDTSTPFTHAARRERAERVCEQSSTPI
eukprot:6174310-Pleurochrysis_carterae.AAC.3